MHPPTQKNKTSGVQLHPNSTSVPVVKDIPLCAQMMAEEQMGLEEPGKVHQLQTPAQFDSQQEEKGHHMNPTHHMLGNAGKATRCWQLARTVTS